jgi:hypothetical protein
VSEYAASTPASVQVGELAMTVDNDANIKGESVNKTINQTATAKGSINNEGKATVDFEFPDQSASEYGTIVKTSKGLITGTMTQRPGRFATGSIEFALKPKANRRARRRPYPASLLRPNPAYDPGDRTTRARSISSRRSPISAQAQR